MPMKEQWMKKVRLASLSVSDSGDPAGRDRLRPTSGQVFDRENTPRSNRDTVLSPYRMCVTAYSPDGSASTGVSRRHSRRRLGYPQ
ncbi:Os01g0136750 [Oryza sativa Japonica Group]|uniref:Os01g0136750 protein n=1 Tax=Oryza sativa subsp. japonica TaxID=39947 RepID=C7IXL5_ORYSJ|nr:Os01g0136750 [Oryza sativa Japonica Group]|eukprot:NP_001172166.1 Os01g0136750 [Oryza sativa Japonica Group]